MRTKCDVSACDNPVGYENYCTKHSYRIKKYGTSDLPTKLVKLCSVTNCNNKHYAKEMCTYHYHQKYQESYVIKKKHLKIIKKVERIHKNYDYPTQKKLKTWSKRIRRRDSYSCQICGEPAAVAHHILSKQNFPKLSLNLNNGISLCLKHHKEIHSPKSIRVFT